MIVTYGDDQQGYPHPDHLRDHEITVAAFDAAGDPDRFLDDGRTVEPEQGVLHDVVRSEDPCHAREVPRARVRVSLRRGVAGASFE